MSQISESSKTAGSAEPTPESKFRSRKFILSCATIAAATALNVGGFITGDNWVSAAQFVTVGYVIGQAWQDRG
jgi:hypothetical protein